MIGSPIRKLTLVLAVAAIGLFPNPQAVQSQSTTYIFLDTIIQSDTLLIVDVADTIGCPGDVVPVTIFVQNLTDSIAGYQMSITLSRPDLMTFSADTVIDSNCIICLDSLCLVADTVICTVMTVPTDVAGTLSENWDFTQGNTNQGLNIRLTGIADVDGDQFPLPLLPFTSGALIKVVGTVICDVEDTITDRTVVLDLNTVGTFFSTSQALTIPSTDSTLYGPDTVIVELDTTITYDSVVLYRPVPRLIDGSVTIPFVFLGDLNCDQVYNVLDVVTLVGIAFRSDPPSCPPSAANVTCDPQGDVNVFDVVKLVDHVFRNGPVPSC